MYYQKLDSQSRLELEIQIVGVSHSDRSCDLGRIHNDEFKKKIKKKITITHTYLKHDFTKPNVLIHT